MLTLHYTFGTDIIVTSSEASDLEMKSENCNSKEFIVFKESLWRLVSDIVKDKRPFNSEMLYKKYQIEFQKLREIHKILLVLYCADVS